MSVWNLFWLILGVTVGMLLAVLLIIVSGNAPVPHDYQLPTTSAVIV